MKFSRFCGLIRWGLKWNYSRKKLIWWNVSCKVIDKVRDGVAFVGLRLRLAELKCGNKVTALKLHWSCTETAPKPPWKWMYLLRSKASWTAVKLLWTRFEPTHRSHWNCVSVSVKSLWNCTRTIEIGSDSAPRWRRVCCEPISRLHQKCTEIALKSCSESFESSENGFGTALYPPWGNFQTTLKL